MEHARHSLLKTLAVGGMETCWLYAILAIVQTRACDQCLIVPGLFIFYPFAYGLHRFFLKARGNILLRQILSWFLWLMGAVLFTGSIANGSGLPNTGWFHPLAYRIFALASFPTPEFLAFAGSAILWGCGKRLSRLGSDESIVLSEFQFGVFILLVVFFLDGQWKLDVHGLVPLTMIFFFFALTGLPSSLLHSGPGLTSEGRRASWFGIVVGVVCLVLAAGLIAASILKPELLNLLWSLVEAAGRFIGRLIVKLIAFLASILPEPEPPRIEMPVPPSAGIEKDPSFIAKVLRIPESVRRVAGMIVSTIWIVLFLAAIWSLSSALIKWLLQRVTHPNGAEVETLSGAFREDIYALMKSLVRMMDRLLSIFLGFFGVKRIRKVATLETMSARAIYRQLLRWSAKKGCPRRRAQTPGEYLDVLAEALPGGYPEFSLITSGYIEERYSPVPAAPGRLEQIRESWRRVKRRGRKNRGTRDDRFARTKDETA